MVFFKEVCCKRAYLEFWFWEGCLVYIVLFIFSGSLEFEVWGYIRGFFNEFEDLLNYFVI